MKSSQAVSCFKMECISVLETISASVITSLKMEIATASKTLEIHSVLTQMTVQEDSAFSWPLKQEESLCKNSSKHWPMIKNWRRRKHTPILFIKLKMKMPSNVTHCWCNLADASKCPIMEMLQLSLKITGIFNAQKSAY